MWYFFIKRIPTDVVCTVILFLLDLSSLNKDGVLYPYFSMLMIILYIIESVLHYTGIHGIPQLSHIFQYSAVFKLSSIL